MLEIKPFNPQADYPHLADIQNAIFTDEFLTAETCLEQDQNLPSHILHHRRMAWLEGQAVGFADYSQNPEQYHPQRFEISLMVHPTFTRRGIGSILYNALLQDLAQHKPIALLASTREDHFGLAFLQKRGFVEKMRTWEQRLFLSDFNLAPLRENLEPQGIHIINLEQFLQQPNAASQYHRLSTLITRDVPDFFPVTERGFADWASEALDESNVLAGGTVFAMHQDQPIGFTQLFASESQYITIGLTGVLPENRGRQIVLALKAASLEWAKAQGYLEVRTWNDSSNAPILALNQKLGFVRAPGYIECLKEVEL